MHYNVLSEPWIPARLPDGSIREYGVLELLEHAHELVEITDSMPNYEYGMYRFLFVFLMDACHPKRQRDIRLLLERGSFDMDLIRTYVEECNRDGERFDLLDEKHPFLQQAEGWDEKPDLKSPANLNPAMPSGNNHVHFDHTTETESDMGLREAVKALCSLNLFSTAGVQGYPSTPSGAPPVYSIVQGDNLFQTLAYGMVRSNLYANYDDPAPAWRSDMIVRPKEKTASTSLLYGLLFPCRRVRLIQGESGSITGIRYEQGMNYDNYEAWTDPYVTYYIGKNGRQNLKPNMDKENWRNLDTILNKEIGAPQVVTEAAGYEMTSELHLITYSAVTNQMNYLDLQRGNYSIPVRFLEDKNLYGFMCALLKAVEDMGSSLSKNIFTLQNSMGMTEGAAVSEKNRTLGRYYFECRKAFFHALGGLIEDTADTGRIQEDWTRTVRRIRWEEYNQFVERLGGDSRFLLEAERIKTQNIRKEEK